MQPPALPPKRARGRPPGSTRHAAQDAKDLAAVADLLAANPKLRRGAAIRQVVKGIEDSHRHRLNRKWRQQQIQLMAAAHARREAAERRRTVQRPNTLSDYRGVTELLGRGVSPFVRSILSDFERIERVMRPLDEIRRVAEAADPLRHISPLSRDLLEFERRADEIRRLADPSAELSRVARLFGRGF